jgi:zinc-binding alcohol dehydrogenase/oxidoreductase
MGTNKMRAILLTGPQSSLVLSEIDIPEPAPDEVLISLKAASVNRRDIWIWQGDYGNISYPCVIGSDGAGVIAKLGPDVDQSWLNQHVIINPSLNWGSQRAGHGNGFQILGVPTQGTFAEYICVPVSNVYRIPDGYDFEKAAALPLAGLTAHRALFYRGDLKAHYTILITGIGGGVSSFLLGFAIRAGARIYVSSSSEKKIEKAVLLGAVHGVNYNDENWVRQLMDSEPAGFDLIIDSAGGLNFLKLIDLLKPGGKIVNFGRTAGNIPEMAPSRLFYKNASILGTTMGSPADFESMLDFIEEYNMRPVIDRVFDWKETDEAFNYLRSSAQFGKVILRIC